MPEKLTPNPVDAPPAFRPGLGSERRGGSSTNSLNLERDVPSLAEAKSGDLKQELRALVEAGGDSYGVTRIEKDGEPLHIVVRITSETPARFMHIVRPGEFTKVDVNPEGHFTLLLGEGDDLTVMGSSAPGAVTVYAGTNKYALKQESAAAETETSAPRVAWRSLFNRFNTDRRPPEDSSVVLKQWAVAPSEIEAALAAGGDSHTKELVGVS